MTELAACTQDNRKPAGASQPGPIAVDDSRAEPLYANFCRVVGLPEELIVDFGVNLEPFSVPTAPIGVSRRLVAGYFAAKRLAEALAAAVHRHEALFGRMETDVVRRAAARPQ